MLQRVASPVAVVLLALFITTSFVDPSPVSSPATAADFAPWVDTSDRSEVLDVFRSAFERDVPDLRWTGDADGCRPGDSSDALRRETMVRIAFYRAMAGVPAVVEEDAVLSEKAQAAALMMSVEGELTHHPDETYGCYSDVGREAAANSNLYLGRTGPAAIDGYIEDPGEGNIDVGHRATILHPPTVRMGVGHVEGSGDRFPANALWVFDDEVFERDYQTREPERFVAWPPRGFVPAEVVYPRWSFALQEADFSTATVTMTADDGSAVPLEIVTRLSKMGEIPSSVIVWEPRIDIDNVSGDTGYTVTVSDVGLPSVESAPERTSFTYRVVVMDLSAGRGALRSLLANL